MNNWKVILATMVIFGAGVMTGGLLVMRSAQLWAPKGPRGQPWFRTNAPVASAGGMRLEFLRRAQQDLKLTPEQHARVDRILKESQERIHKLMEPVSPLMKEELQRAKDEVRAALRPAQRERFDQLIKQQQRPRDPRHGPRDTTNEPAPARPPAARETP